MSPFPNPCSATYFPIPSSELAQTELKSKMYRKALSEKKLVRGNTSWVKVETLPITPVLFYLGRWRLTKVVSITLTAVTYLVSTSPLIQKFHFLL